MVCRVGARPAQSHTEYANGSGREDGAADLPPRRTHAGASRKAGSPIKEVGLMKLCSQPDLFRPGCVRDAEGSIARRGFARGAAVPGLGGKCADARSKAAEMPVNNLCGVPRGYLALASHSGSCEHGCRDQCSRQKFKLGHLISPWDVQSQQRVAPPCKWSSDRPIEVTFPHRLSTPREVGRVVRSFTQFELVTK